MLNITGLFVSLKVCMNVTYKCVAVSPDSGVRSVSGVCLPDTPTADRGRSADPLHAVSIISFTTYPQPGGDFEARITGVSAAEQATVLI